MRIGALLTSAVLLAGGCAMLPEMIASTAEIPLAGKIVAAKVEPNELVAEDGTRCTVSRESWERAQVGRHHVCAWSSD